MEDTPMILMSFLNLKLIEFCLRLLVFPLCTASLWLMVSNKQVNIYGELKYDTLSGLEYMIIINAMAIGYTLVAVPLSCHRSSAKNWVLFTLDQIIAYLMTTSGSAAMEVLYLAYKGDRVVSWSTACDSYGEFCGKAKVSLLFHFMTLLCFIILSGASAYRVFSKFEAPKEVADENM
ncbi:CASP-like protein 2D1 [Nymphaea thermarum]|nr:CASP-like protein 2D1 [Nymphaea thermarum]